MSVDTAVQTSEVVQTLESQESEVSKESEATVLFREAMQSAEAGQLDRASEGLKRVITVSPDLSVPHNNLGVLYKRRGLLDQAIMEYKEAIRIKPSYAEAHNNLALAYREKGLLKKAEQSYQEALRQRSDLPQANYNLAVLYDLYLNEPRKAIDHYRRYLKKADRGQREVQTWISILQRKLREELDKDHEKRE